MHPKLELDASLEETRRYPDVQKVVSSPSFSAEVQFFFLQIYLPPSVRAKSFSSNVLLLSGLLSVFAGTFG